MAPLEVPVSTHISISHCSERTGSLQNLQLTKESRWSLFSTHSIYQKTYCYLYMSTLSDKTRKCKYRAFLSSILHISAISWHFRTGMFKNILMPTEENKL